MEPHSPDTRVQPPQNFKTENHSYHQQTGVPKFRNPPHPPNYNMQV
jgi:hypothetical protein